jgi:carboxymethylenebutenolidase
MDDRQSGRGSAAAITPKITQEMINLYDEYTHLTLDRRGFMEKLTRLAGSAAAAAAIAPLIAPSAAKAAIVADDDPRVVPSAITYPGKSGAVKAYLVKPDRAAAKLPAVVVIHENRGLNPHIMDVARRVAVEGFMALAPDLLSPDGGTPADENAAAQLIAKLDLATTIGDLVAATAYLRTRPDSNGKVGAIGFCWGGGMANQLAAHDPLLVAASVYYGPQPSAADAANIKAKLMLHYAGLDQRVDAGIPAYEAALKAAGVRYQLFIYPGANHAFNNDTSAARYDKAAADLAWARTIGLLRGELG